ncbi:hypothetical protein THMIRHAM_02950 [Thiomicrorhabdus immobilis]|uniref:Uncharacterized protein n=1 Tax=Thiomicrorhabdus immobilis TaxID=2791037 RepID=A0ABN6CU76_9GAMM|nr:hypothetical protein [Thiomicrorhabdus immobilis]BCN92510.1 hypothetical protein THMIRHAM_02950 [Thiomicrorhabdus immobilis]
MNAEQFTQALNDFSDENYQEILDGAALIIHEDKGLTLGKSQQAYVIFELGDESFDSSDALKASLIERAEDLIQEYYQYNPISKMHFNNQLQNLIKEHGANAFVTMPGQEATVKLFVEGSDVIVETNESPRFKYGFCLVLNEKVLSQAVENKVKNWVSSGSAYDDYISVNVCRFSSTDMEELDSSDYV